MWYRGIAQDKRYSQDLDDYRRLYPAIDEVQRLLEWELTRNPNVGDQLPTALDFRTYRTPSHEDVPSFHILYSFDENTIYLHSIQPVTE